MVCGILDDTLRRHPDSCYGMTSYAMSAGGPRRMSVEGQGQDSEEYVMPGEVEVQGPLRVLHVVTSLDAGGTERVICRVADALYARGIDVWVCGLERRGALADTFRDPSRVLSVDKPAGRSPATVLRLHRLMRQVQPDVVHTHNLGPLLYGSVASGFGRFWPVLHGEHGQLIGEHLGPPRLGLRRWLYGACRRVHTVSNQLREDLIGLGFRADRVVAVVNGVDTTIFTPGGRAAAQLRLGLSGEGPVIVISARLVRSKRHDLLIRAVAALANEGSDVRLLIAGDGPLRGELEALTQSCGVSQAVRFLGFRDDMPTIYQAADMMVFPSTGEGLSNAILEAMACGTPVLCHAACGCSEVITDGQDGWVKDIASMESLTDLLRSLLCAPDAIRQVGLAARRRICDHFSISQTVAGYERLYREIV